MSLPCVTKMAAKALALLLVFSFIASLFLVSGKILINLFKKVGHDAYFLSSCCFIVARQ